MKKAARKNGKLVPQPHGGALLDGACPPEHHVPGPGRPTSRIRGALREVFDRAVGTLDNVSRGRIFLTFFSKCPECGHEEDVQTIPAKVAMSDVLRAIEIAAKYSVGEAKGYDEALVEALGVAVRDEVSDEVWGRIRERWVLLIGLHVTGS